jgi:hypothetical protein
VQVVQMSQFQHLPKWHQHCHDGFAFSAQFATQVSQESSVAMIQKPNIVMTYNNDMMPSFVELLD